MSHRFLKTYLLEIVLFTLFLLFSVWLMFGTFSYKNGSMMIASKAWSDFANHIPLIRSFSFGSNFPPQDPLFSGEPIHYHFLFYLFVGLLEKLGVRIDYALNIPSLFGFFALLIVLYFFGKQVFHSRAVGVLNVIFFLFNGSLSFLEFFKLHPLGSNTIRTIITNTTFPSFGPYDQKVVSAFWNLNIYTNQRHLAAAYALSLFLIYLLLYYCHFERKNETKWTDVVEKSHTTELQKQRRGFRSLHSAIASVGMTKVNFKKTNWILSISLGIILGVSFFFHLAVFLMTVIILCCLFVLFKNLRVATCVILLTAAVIAFPQYLYLRSGGLGFSLRFVPGYLISDHLTFQSFFMYWFYNFGLHLLLIPIGFIFAPKNIKKLFIAFCALFLIGNLFQFAPEMAENHKFFNYFLLFGNMLSAYILALVWQKNILIRPFVVIVTLFLLLSGIIDFFPVYNDNKIALADYPINPDSRWIMYHTSPKATILNTNYLYDSASIAGRKIYLGWPYFPWSSGFDTTTRSNAIKHFFTLKSKREICTFLTKNRVDFVNLTIPSQDFPFDPHFWQENFSPLYTNPQTHLTIYKTTDICSM